MAKILVIDDDADFVAATRTWLEAHGFEVDEAATPDEGIARVLSGHPDVVVLDVMMPEGFEGFEAARAIREQYGLVNLPIVILTGLHSKREVPYRFAPDQTYVPVDVFLDKTTSPDVLVATIKELLGERREEPKFPL